MRGIGEYKTGSNTEKEHELIKWQLKYLSGLADQMTENELEWAIRMEEAYKSQGWLSENQMATLENIYSKY